MKTLSSIALALLLLGGCAVKGEVSMTPTLDATESAAASTPAVISATPTPPATPAAAPTPAPAPAKRTPKYDRNGVPVGNLLAR